MLSLLMFRPWPLILPAVRMLRFLWGVCLISFLVPLSYFPLQLVNSFS